MDDILERHKKTWEEKKILRVIYSAWYEKIIKNLSKQEGLTVELGAGSGNFKEFMPEAISSDIEKCDWLDMAFDAHRMPFENETVSNLVMVDVFHHLAEPVNFLTEAKRVLKKEGRIIMLEPFPSFFSLIIYRKFHPEPFIFEHDYFNQKPQENAKDPWDSNQAIPYLIFFKHFEKFEKNFGKEFEVIKKEKLSCILYPASGGFENKSMIPDFLIPAFQGLEVLLTPLRPVMAFRCYIVLEKK